MKFPQIRQLLRDRRRNKKHRLVGIDQSFSNYAMVLFEEGVPIDRCVFHTGDPTTKKNQAKDPVATQSRFFVSPLAQLEYLYQEVLDKIAEWNPHDIAMEGLSFGSNGNMERQLGALYFGLQVSLIRELGYSQENLFSVTPKQCKNFAREFLIGDDQYEKKGDEIVLLKSKKPKLNQMKGKKDMIKALENTPYGWLIDGYTRDGLAASKRMPTGMEDLPDAYMIGLYILEQNFEYKEKRP